VKILHAISHWDYTASSMLGAMLPVGGEIR
jgi:hypothetical protein